MTYVIVGIAAFVAGFVAGYVWCLVGGAVDEITKESHYRDEDHKKDKPEAAHLS